MEKKELFLESGLPNEEGIKIMKEYKALFRGIIEDCRDVFAIHELEIALFNDVFMGFSMEVSQTKVLKSKY